MADSRCAFLGIALAFLSCLVVGQSLDGGGICNLDLDAFLPPPYGNLSRMECHPVWNNFVLRYSQSGDNVVTFVLSALYTSGWVGIGFSKDGKMEGASAVVGWISRTGHARIKQYYAAGYTPGDVKQGKGELNFTSITPLVVLDSANIYLAFQLKFAASVRMQPTLLAFGSRYPTVNTHQLSKHDDKVSLLIDYSLGGGVAATEFRSYDKMKRSHGVLGIVGWGLILPVGAMVARFLRHREPLWFYLHTIIQLTGFLIVLAGVIVGQALNNRVHADVAAHRGIGYFALSLAILQILAFFVRPNRESKVRNLWNTYHMLSGVAALFFGALNIILGIQGGGAGSQWKIGYGILLGLVIITAVVLQIMSLLRGSAEKVAQPAQPEQVPAYRMNLH